MTPDVRVLPLAELPAAAARAVAELLVAAVDARGDASLVLAGGSTPRATYRALAALSLPWARIDVLFGDERAVAPDDPASNYAMARAALLDQVRPRRVLRIAGEDGAEAAAAAYAPLVPARPDVVLLGVGEDGHTLSLFPGAPTLRGDRRVVAARAPGPPVDRVTLTPPVLADARALIVLATGAGKAAAVAAALADGADPARVPAALARRGVWFLDPDAARQIRGQQGAP
jgi:6-phosphogluconolactonase